MTSDVVRWSQLYMQQNKPQKRDDVMTSSEHLRPSYRNHANVNIALANKHSRNTRRSLIAGTVGTQLHKIVLLVLWLVINQNVSLVLSEPILATNNLTIAVKSITGDDEQIHMPVDNDLAVESMSLQDSQNLNQQHSHQTTDDDDSSRHFTPTWAVHVPGGDSVAERIAEDHGFRILGKIFDDYYHFHHSEIRKRSIEPSHHHQTRLNNDDRVRWSQQQHIKTRKKRDFLTFHDQKPYPMLMGKNRVMTSDPKWPAMWYLHRGNGLDMNVIPAWKEGITGKGIVVTILDDGLESDHPDLVENFDPKASYDVNSHDDDPMPHYDMDDSNRHGTRCAGEVAATFNNSLCCVGIAHGASVGGVRMLDGDVTDAVEARSLSLNPQHIDIYSASWGPDDDGKTVDGPGELATRAFIEGVTKGRKGKGSIFIWASGNGGKDHDNCNCDGYTNSIWTLSISSATERGLVPWYSEKCSSTLATTYSSGSKEERQVVTTDLHHSCTASHTGTSASAPLAAGIAALVLEANPSLTWRDLQHIVVRTAKPANLQDPSWSKNGVGRRVSHSFGYGLMDAAAMIKVARTWKTVPEQQRCEIYAPSLDKAISPKSYVVISLKVQPHQCESVNYLEHVQAKISLTSPRRGDIQIFLTSPAGTKVTLLTSRSHDSSRSGFNQWPFMSVHTWGESPHGQWLLEIRNEGRFMGHTALKGWSLIFYGSKQPIDKNDPVSVPLLPLNTLYNTPNTNNQAANVTKGNNGGKGNRKQQQQQQHQQKSSQSNGSQSTGRKNGKTNGKNQNGKNWKPRLTSPRPTLTTLSNKNRNKFEPMNGIAFTNKIIATTTIRPIKLSNNNVDNKDGEKTVYIKSPVKAPKQIKEIITVISTRLDDGNESISTVKSTTSASVAKSNVARITTASPLDAHFELVGSFQYTSNPNIPKLFQRYEKIQEFYPEFHPYVGLPKASSSVSSSSGGGSVAVKPSRDGSKHNHFTFISNNQQAPPSSTFAQISNGRSHEILSLSQKPSTTRTQSSAIISSTNGKAQVTQWGLILHGTEEPAQPNDPKSFDFPQPDPNFLSEIDQSLDFDQTETGQWRNLQQGGENGHNDVQRTAASNDQTDSACLKSLPNKYCIECEQTTFIYEGRCYTACPERTYMLPETPLITKPKTNSTSTKPPRKRAIVQSIPQKKCGACHATCLRCRGPLNNECTECPTESILRGALPNETYCDRASEHNENGWPKVIKLFDNDHNSNNTEHNFSHKSIFKVFFDHISIYMVMAYIVSVIIVMLIIRIACKSFYSNTTTTISNDKKNYAYNRINTVGYDGNDHIIMEHEMIINTSDSSEETETIK
ncbi:furin-like protease 1 isoform X1 [Contarinia nasturtii]|uniref:furin-like protease 1 isoform X1 n=1 Tax=Contarinia nasturtii TaxID=265458 RepID=UPI0012D3EB73|nr:furin-like protease 1 isoform X1 [Contarinia nasturtii]